MIDAAHTLEDEFRRMSTDREWLLAFADLGKGKKTCPQCGQAGLMAIMEGDPTTRVGGGVLLCRACHTAARISRAKVPESIPLMDAEEAQLLLNQWSLLRFVDELH